MKAIFFDLFLTLLIFNGTFSATLKQEDVVNENRHQGVVPSYYEIHKNTREIHRKSPISEMPKEVNTIKQRQPLTDIYEDDPYEVFRENLHHVTATTGRTKAIKSLTKAELVEAEEQRQSDIKRYSILLLPWLIFPMSKASYFTTLELFDAYCDKLGVPAEITLVILIMLQCVDVVALRRGRWKIMDGTFENGIQEMLDYFLNRLGAENHQKIAVQLLLPTNDWPEYEQKK